MSTPYQALDRVCSHYTRRIVECAQDPALATESHIENEVKNAMVHLTAFPQGAPKVSLKLFSMQLEESLESLTAEDRTSRLILRAYLMVENRIREMGPEEA